MLNRIKHLEQFIPTPDFRERHSVIVQAPAELVMDITRNFDFRSVFFVKAIFWVRSHVLRAKNLSTPGGAGLVAYTQSLGWGVLLDRKHVYVSGAVCQPWQADVVFQGVPADRFQSYSEPGFVKIVWSIEVEALDPEQSRLSTETRVVATDEAARARFRRYWLIFRIGIVTIRRFMLSAIRRDAERQSPRI